MNKKAQLINEMNLYFQRYLINKKLMEKYIDQLEIEIQIKKERKQIDAKHSMVYEVCSK